MVEYYKPTPIEDRKSENTTFADGAIWFGKLAAVGAAGAAAAWAGAKLLKPKIKMPQFMKEFMFREEEHLQAKDYALIGGKTAVIGKLFMMWRKSEAERKGVEDMLEGVNDIAQHHQSNEDLIKDNALVKDMIEFEERKQENLRGNETPERAINTQESKHDGAVSSPSAEQELS